MRVRERKREREKERDSEGEGEERERRSRGEGEESETGVEPNAKCTKVLIPLGLAGGGWLLPPENNEELVATQILLHDCVLLRRCICAFLCDVCVVSGEKMEV